MTSVGRKWPTSSRLPNNVRRKVAPGPRFDPEFGQAGPVWPSSGQTWSNSGHLWSKSGHFWPANAGRDCQSSGQAWSISGHTWPNSGSEVVVQVRAEASQWAQAEMHAMPRVIDEGGDEAIAFCRHPYSELHEARQSNMVLSQMAHHDERRRPWADLVEFSRCRAESGVGVGVDLGGPILGADLGGRSWGRHRGRCAVDLGPSRHRAGVELGSVRRRCGVDAGLTATVP